MSGEQRPRTFKSKVPLAGSSVLKIVATFSRKVFSMSTLLIACSESWREGFCGMMMSCGYVSIHTTSMWDQTCLCQQLLNVGKSVECCSILTP